MAMESGTVADASPPSAVVLLSRCAVAVALSDRAGPTQRFSTSAHMPMVSYSLAKYEPCPLNPQHLVWRYVLYTKSYADIRNLDLPPGP